MWEPKPSGSLTEPGYFFPREWEAALPSCTEFAVAERPDALWLYSRTVNMVCRYRSLIQIITKYTKYFASCYLHKIHRCWWAPASMFFLFIIFCYVISCPISSVLQGQGLLLHSGAYGSFACHSFSWLYPNSHLHDGSEDLSLAHWKLQGAWLM